MWAGPRPRVAASFGKDKNVLRAGVDALSAADAPADIRGALALALSASEGRGEREIVLLSDGAFDPVADLSMGIDNMLAVGAASHGNLFLLLFGLALSIPFVVFMSNLLAKLMDKYPIILWAGAAILGKVGGEMMITDPWVHGLLGPPKWVEYAVMVFFVAFVCGLSKWILNKHKAEISIEQTTTTEGTADRVIPADTQKRLI